MLFELGEAGLIHRAELAAVLGENDLKYPERVLFVWGLLKVFASLVQVLNRKLFFQILFTCKRMIVQSFVIVFSVTS